MSALSSISNPDDKEIKWKSDSWTPMPDVKDMKEAINMIASPTSMFHWRSSDNTRTKILLGDNVTEPLSTNDEYVIEIEKLTYHVRVIEFCNNPQQRQQQQKKKSSNHDHDGGIYVFDTLSTSKNGKVYGRLRITIFEMNGLVFGRAQEIQQGGGLFFSTSSGIPKIEKDYKTMFLQLNAYHERIK